MFINSLYYKIIILCILGFSSCTPQQDSSEKTPQKNQEERQTHSIDTPGVYFLSTTKGPIVALEDDGFRELGSADRLYSDAIPRRTGGMWLVETHSETGEFKLLSYDGKKIEIIGNDKIPGKVVPVLETPQGVLWALSHHKLAKYENNSWTVLSPYILNAPNELITDLRTSEDSLYVLTSKQLHVQKDNKWTHLPLPTDRGIARTLTVSPDNNVYFYADQQLFQLQEGAFKKLKEFSGMYTSFTIDGDGTFWISDLTRLWTITGETLRLIKDAGRLSDLTVGSDNKLYGLEYKKLQLKTISEDKLVTIPYNEILKYKIQAFTTDQAGRIWATTQDLGIIVIDQTPKEKILYWPPGTFKTLPTKVKSIVTNGSISSIPEAEPATTNVVGIITDMGGSPIADVPIEVCDGAQKKTNFFGQKPCSDNTILGHTKTGNDGSFTLKKLPYCCWNLTYKVGKTWHSKAITTCCEEIKKGKAFDMGIIKVETLETPKNP